MEVAYLAGSVFIDTTQAITRPLSTIANEFIQIIPNLIAAIVVLIIGAFVAVILGHALRVILDKTRLDDALRRLKLTKAVGHTDVPSLLGELLKWWIVIVFLQQAVALVDLGTLTEMLDRFVLWLPKLLVAVIIVLAGLAAAHFVDMKIQEHTKLKGMRLAGLILKWLIVIMVALVALRNIGIDVQLIEQLFLYVIVALAAGIALALGIGLGLGLKKQSEGFITSLKKGL